MEEQEITQAEFADLVAKFMAGWNDADKQALLGHRVATALRLMLTALNIKIKRQWKDGDVVHGAAATKTTVQYVRREGKWYELPRDGQPHFELRVYDDERIDKSVHRGSLVEWKP